MAFDVASAIHTAADQYGVDPGLALKIAQTESALNPAAVSPKGALGPMQLMPATAKDMGVDPHDVQQNIVGGVKYLRQLSDRYGGDHDLIAAAYNAGPGAVDKHGGVPPFAETQAYVQKVTGNDHRLPTPESVLQSIGYDPKPSAPAAPGAADQLPSPDDVLKGMGWTAPKTPDGPKVSPGQAKANADAQAFMVGKDASGKSILAAGDAPPHDAMAAYNTLNAMTLDTLPMLHGAGMAAAIGIQNALSHVGLAKAQPYSMGESYTANRDAMSGELGAYQQAHPLASTAQQLVGFGAGGPAALVEKSAGKVLTKAAPKMAESLAGRLAISGTKAGAVGASAGAGAAASDGGNAGDITKGAGLGFVATAPLGVAGHALAGLPALGGVSRGVVAPVVGAAGGAALGGATGYLQGGPTGAKTGAETGAALGALSGLRMGRGAAEVTPKDRAAALDLIKKATPEVRDALSGAIPEHTTAEALGPEGQALVQQAAQAGEKAVAPLTERLTERGQAQAKMDRLAADVQSATGIDPATAHQDITEQVDAARKGPAKQAYDAALQGKPVWTPELSELAKEPEVRTALNNARRLLGSEAMVDNPGARATDGGAPIISAKDYQTYLKTGDESLLGGGQPAVAPTDRTWDLAKQLLDKSVSRDALGHTEPSTDNHLAQEWSRRLRSALDDAIPGYEDARAVAGDYLSSRQAYEQGQKLWTTTRPDNNASAFGRRFDKLTPAEQQATRSGYLSEFYRRLENGKLDPKAYLDTPFHQQAIKAMFGEDRAAQMAKAVQREQALAASAKVMMSSARSAPAHQAEDHALGPAAGAMIGFAEGGPHGALRGLIGGSAAKGARGVLSAMREGRVTPQVRTALGDILAQSPADTAAELKAAKPKEKKLSESTLMRAFGAGARRGTAGLAGATASHAFAGVRERE